MFEWEGEPRLQEVGNFGLRGGKRYGEITLALGRIENKAGPAEHAKMDGIRKTQGRDTIPVSLCSNKSVEWKSYTRGTITNLRRYRDKDNVAKANKFGLC